MIGRNLCRDHIFYYLSSSFLQFCRISWALRRLSSCFMKQNLSLFEANILLISNLHGKMWNLISFSVIQRPNYQIALGNIVCQKTGVEINTKDVLEGIICIWIIKSDHLSLLQKAVAQNKIELIEKFITEFKMDLNRTSEEYPLPPIFIALSKRKVRSTEKLIQAGADLMRKIFIDGNELK